MSDHDPRCEGIDDAKLLADVEEYGWHVVKILEKDDTPGWAFSVGLNENFNHPEIVVFGLNGDLMHSMINAIGDDVREGKTFAIDDREPRKNLLASQSIPRQKAFALCLLSSQQKLFHVN
jgi:hypothetical protein